MLMQAICDRCGLAHTVAALVMRDGEPDMICPTCSGCWPTIVDWLDASGRDATAAMNGTPEKTILKKIWNCGV
jgi:hypothetical protein